MKTIIIIDTKFKGSHEKIENFLQHFGLRKIQSQTYFGELEKTELTKLKQNIDEIVKTQDSVLILPVCMKCYKNKSSHGYELSFTEELYKVF